MNFSLIICTYMRPKALINLLNSVKKQKLYPDEILIIDGSINSETEEMLNKNVYRNLKYYKVKDVDKGLTRQRNFGIYKVSKSIDVVCFLDDDVILIEDYFEKLIETYESYPNAKGVGGYTVNEVNWKKLNSNQKPKYNEYEIDGWVRNLGSRNVLRKKIKLLSDKPPCIMPEFSNGFSVSSLPPNDKVYKVEHFMGGVSSFKKEVVDSIKFSTYFEDYGLYEDLEYCLRVSKKHPLYVNTAAKLYHYHATGGRPNKYKYGKMVLRNGWYVWRTKFPKPSLRSRIKWNLIVLVLTLIRFANVLTTSDKKGAFAEALGRSVGWWSLIFNRVKIKL